MKRCLFLFAAFLANGCGDDETVTPIIPDAVPGTTVLFDLDGDLGTAATFYDFPFPSDLRLGPSGAPDYSGIPGGDLDAALSLVPAAQARPGFPAIPVVYFRFDGAIAPQDPETMVAADATSSILLVDIDPASPDRGTLHPTIALTPHADAYVPENLVAVAPLPGVVLPAGRLYGVVLRRSLGDAAGAPLGVPKSIVDLAAGATPAGARGADAVTAHAPLWETLDQLGVPRADVAAATVFTVGDVVAETAALSDAIVDAHDVTIADLAIDPDDGADHPRFCELHGTMTMPQFQHGTPPWDDDGTFDTSGDRLVSQGTETVPVVIAIPKQPMPDGGYPLVLYIHGSGGLAAQVVDRGKVTMPEGMPTPGEGPAHVLAEHGFASVGAAMPLNPERLPGASDYVYINIGNLGAFPYTFRQGVFEQRLLLEALRSLTIDPAVLATCTGPTLPGGETAFHFDMEPMLAMGQSMGGQYVNMLSAVEPTIEAVVPTGAGGHWSRFMLVSKLLGGVKGIVAGQLDIEVEDVHPLHPAIALLETAWEPADAIVSAARLAARPLDGHPVRSIYEPVGLDDEYFPTVLYDEMAMAYGNQQAGDEVWTTMQPSLAAVGLDGVAAYPVAANRPDRTGVVVQYEPDGILNGHYIFQQLDEVKYQYGCFFKTFRDTGVATVPAPAPLGTPCP